MYLANILIIISYLGYLLIISINKSDNNSIDGFNVTKDALASYDCINIIENKSLFTTYNLKRKIIKIATKHYYGKSSSDISICLLEAGISAIDDNNKTLNIFRKVFSNLKYLYIFPIISILANSITYTIGDARICLILLSFFSIISYFLVTIKENAFIWINDNIKKIKKINHQKILKIIKKELLFNKIIFYSEIIMLARFILIILNNN